MSFSIQSILDAGSNNFGDLRDVLLLARAALEAKKAQFPDATESVDRQIAALDLKIAELDAALSEVSTANLAVIVLPEALNIIRLKLEPKAHAGDSI